MLPLETLPPPGDPIGGVVYLRIVLSPEQASHLWMFLNISVLQGRVVSTSPNPQAGGPPLVGCPRLLIQFIRSCPPYRRPFLYPQPEDAPCHGDRDPLHGCLILLVQIFIPAVKEFQAQSFSRLVVTHILLCTCSVIAFAGTENTVTTERKSWQTCSVYCQWYFACVREQDGRQLLCCNT